jgi:LacI family transcriptional regulator
MQRVTLKEVAAAVGISVSSAARGLKGRSDISASTRARIQQVVERLGYRPDPMLAALSAYRQSQKPKHFQGTLAFLTTRHDEKMYLNSSICSIEGDLLRGTRQRAESLGYRLDYFNMGKTKRSHQQIWKVLQSRGIRGVLLRSAPLAVFAPLKN